LSGVQCVVMLRSEGVMTFWQSLLLQSAGYNSMGISWVLSCVYELGWDMGSDRLHGPCAGEEKVVVWS